MCRSRSREEMSMRRILQASLVLAFILIGSAGVAADYPAPQEGSWVARDFKFHTGEVLPELRLHYRTIGEQSGRAGGHHARHHGIGCRLPHAGVRRRAVRTRPAARRESLLHHPARRGRPRALEQTLRRAEDEVPALQLRRHGRRAAPPGDRAPRREACAPRDGQLDGRDGNLDLGAEVSRLHGRGGADGFVAVSRCRAATG